MEKCSNEFPERKFNINKYWAKCCCFLDTIGCKSDYCWLDKETYRVIGPYFSLTRNQKNLVDTGSKKRFILLPQYAAELRYKELVKEFNNPAVTQYFADAADEEDAACKYRWFVDWNGLEPSEQYKYFLAIKEILIKWCREKHIKYICYDEAPPAGYCYDGSIDLSRKEWILDGH